MTEPLDTAALRALAEKAAAPHYGGNWLALDILPSWMTHGEAMFINACSPDTLLRLLDRLEVAEGQEWRQVHFDFAGKATRRTLELRKRAESAEAREAKLREALEKWQKIHTPSAHGRCLSCGLNVDHHGCLQYAAASQALSDYRAATTPTDGATDVCAADRRVDQ